MMLPLKSLTMILLLWLSGTAAVIITSPSKAANSFTTTSPSTSTSGSMSIRIRTTRETDVDGIANLLAATALSDKPNWKARLEYLKNVASLKPMLLKRHDVIRQGKKVASKVDALLAEHSDITDADRMRVFWEKASEARFCNDLQKASAVSKEPHVWQSHNFALCPQDARHLQHVMLSASSTAGKVIGFVEIGMLQVPDTKEAVPTIANLVTSPDYRRRGIAAGLLESATRYIQCNWSSEQNLGLYVHKENQNAMALYKKHGFVEISASGDDELYLTKSLHHGRDASFE